MTVPLVERGFRLLGRKMTPAAARIVRYIRGATVVHDAMEGVLSNQQIEQITSADAVIVGRQFTWQLKRAQLVVDGAEDQPRRGDRIEWIYNGRTYVFQVMPEGGLPEANAVDPFSDWVKASVKLAEVQ